MKAALKLAMALTVTSAASATAQAAQRIETPRHTQIEVLRDYPQGRGPFPVLILAPGMGSDARTPLLEAVSKGAVDSGFIVYRLNWSYRVADPTSGKPSPDRQGELEDFRTLADLAFKDASADPTRVIFAGKSLGSYIAWRALQTDARAKAAIELTPLCSDFKPPITFEADYPSLTAQTRPSLWILGDDDKACDVRILHDKLRTASAVTHLLVLSGNHSLETSAPVDPVETSRNLSIATAVVSDFLLRQVK